MSRGSGIRGVLILMVVMMTMAAGSAYVAVVDFDDASLTPGDVVEDWGSVHEYLKITPWDAADADAQIVVDGGSIKAYQGGSTGSGWFEQGNNLCMDDQGLGTEFAVPDVDSTWTFEFADGIVVSDFSIDMLDYGDWFPYGQGTRTATMTAYDVGGAPLNSDTFTAMSLSAALYDSCAVGGGGIQNLSVVGEDIAYVEITFDGVDTGIGFDDIEFDYECGPDGYMTSNLIADGGDEYLDVGGVNVWNDGENLFVEFFTDLPEWVIAAIHIDVETDYLEIDQTKKHNPIPGKFQTKETFEYPWTTYAGVYEFPGAFAEGEVAIAAHAELWDLATDTTMTIRSRPSVDVYGPLTEYASLDDAAWGTPIPAVATWEHTAWPLRAAEADWISTSYMIDEDGVELVAPNTWRWFHDEFDVPGYPLGASVVAATADNAEEFYFNGALVGSDGELQGPFIDNHEWATVLNYGTIATPMILEMGTNEIDFIVRNYSGSSLPTANPTGLIYEVEADYIERSETGWGEGPNFDGSNWAMWIEYSSETWCDIGDLGS